MNLYESLYRWLSTYTHIGSWLYFNVTNFEAGCVSLNSVSMSRYLRKDILGNRVVEMVCAIDMIKDYDTGTSDINLDAIAEVENFAKWIEDNDTKPDFANKEIVKIEVLNNAPSLSVDNEANLAKYQFQIKITYNESEEN